MRDVPRGVERMRITSYQDAAIGPCLPRELIDGRRLKSLRIIDKAEIRKLNTQRPHNCPCPIRATPISNNSLYRLQTFISRHQRADTIGDMPLLIQHRDDSQHLFPTCASRRSR
jgi:hypothetical protein